MPFGKLHFFGGIFTKTFTHILTEYSICTDILKFFFHNHTILHLPFYAKIGHN